VIAEKFVRMLRFDSKRRQSAFGEFLQIHRHDDIAASLDRGGQDVPGRRAEA
jgi:hypothetical protein